MFRSYMEDTEDYMLKFRGPSFNAMIEFAAMKKHSLIQEVEVRTPSELSAIVIGMSVYEVLRDMPECNILINAMDVVKRKQSRLMDKEKIFQWMDENLPSRVVPPLMNQRYMRKCDMRLFLLRCPMSALPNSVFKPFLPIVKSFLLAHLYKFRRNRILYNNPPEFPSEDQLPHVINVLGPIDYLERNYPHLARVKREMIVNITHFTITYCLDWICEVLTLRSDQYGFVTYSYPVSDREEERDSHLSQEDEDFQRNGRGFPRKRKAERERFDYNDNRKRKKGSHFTRNGIPMDEPVATDTQSVNVEESDTAGPSSGISSTPINQLASRMDVEQQPASSQVGEIPTCGDNGLPIDSTIQDDWTEMLDTAFTDPNLPSNYKALIRGLVASNRELKNAITVMESEE